jgi:hypothetical protein
MADATFPSTLPNPTTDFAYSVDSDNVRTKDATALPIGRERSSLRVHQIGIAWSMTDAQLAIFQTFFNTTILKGSMPFNINLPLGDGEKANTARFFEAKYNAANQGFLDWKVTATLVVEDPNEADTCSEYVDLITETEGTTQTTSIPLKCGFLEISKWLLTGFLIADLTTGTLETGS